MKPINGIQYQKIEFDTFRNEFLALVEQLDNAENIEGVHAAIDSINAKRNLWESMQVIAELNHFSDLKNQSYEGAVDHYDNHSGDLKVLVTAYYSAITSSEYRSEIAKTYGQQLLEIASNETKLFDESLKQLQEEESNLVREFGKIFYQIQYQIEDKSYSPDSIKPLLVGADRQNRKSAVSAQSEAFEQHELEITEILIKLIKVRNELARACGFENYVTYNFKKLGRYDYGVSDIEKHRNGILESLVPFTKEIRNRQAQKIGVQDLKFHDYDYLTPCKDLTFEFDSPETAVKISKMFNELSKETGDLFNQMMSNGLIDSEIKENRMPGNFAFYIPEKKTPFIHTNFSGSKEDFLLLCHEFGHTFGYVQSNTEMPEYVFPFVEGAETQSISMEYFCWSWVEEFFGKNATEYKYWHLAFELLYQPQLSLIDEFEQSLYESEPKNASEFSAAWKEIELKYLPFIGYEEADFFTNGGRFMAFSNWFVDYPFWSICYSLAHISAFQFWNEFKADREKGWNKYVKFCKIGGRASVLQALAQCDVKSPLHGPTIHSNIKMVCDELRKLDSVGT
jgi:M3 family oligoendopeptidase